MTDYEITTHVVREGARWYWWAAVFEVLDGQKAWIGTTGSHDDASWAWDEALRILRSRNRWITQRHSERAE